MRQPSRVMSLAVAAAALQLAASSASAAVIPGWYSTTDLSFVASGGNSKTLNGGVTTNLTRQWLRTGWRTTASYIRAEAAEPNARAVGATPASSSIEAGDLVTKSEKLFLNSNFERRVTERFFWNIGGTAERDPFAGLKYRAVGQAGVGYLWQATDNTSRFQAGVAGTYTKEETTPKDGSDTVIDADKQPDDNFPGVRLTLSGEQRFGETKQSVFNSELIVDENVQDTEDIRANWNNAISVSINQKLALKFGVQFAFDNKPQFVEYPFFAGGVDTGQKVSAPAKKLDGTATISLVINFSPGGAASRPNQ